jgi:peptidoglycan/LPS O-acetylase OafA/YrhL
VYVTDIEPVLNVLVRTTARMDAFVAGMLTGAALGLVTRTAVPTQWLLLARRASLVGLVPLAWYCSDNSRFLGLGVTLLELDLAVLAASVSLMSMSVPGFRGHAPTMLVRLGRWSLPIYVWHYPVFAAVTRNTQDEQWWLRVMIAAVLTTALCVANEVFIERRVTRLLDHPSWHRVGGPTARPET